jgi:hypothetical protein
MRNFDEVFKDLNLSFEERKELVYKLISIRTRSLIDKLLRPDYGNLNETVLNELSKSK